MPGYFAASGIPIWDMTETPPKAGKHLFGVY